MTSDPSGLPLAVSHRDPSGLFAIETTVVAWREAHSTSSRVRVVVLTLGGGTLRDADKGSLPLDGLTVAMHIADGRLEPGDVPEPGPLSELQQDALLDAVRTALDADGRLVVHLIRRSQ